MRLVCETLTDLAEHDKLVLDQAVTANGAPGSQHRAALSRGPLLVDGPLRTHCFPAPCHPANPVDRPLLRRRKPKAGETSWHYSEQERARSVHGDMRGASICTGFSLRS